ADARADQRGLAGVHMHDRRILEVRGFPDHNRRHVAAQDRLIPHARAGAQRHIAEHDGARRDEGSGVDYWRTGWNGHCTHASTGSPFFWAGFQRRFLAMSSASLLNVSTLDGT